MDKNIYLGSDHAGLEMKNALKAYLQGKDLKLVDLGCFNGEEVDYPDIAREVSEKVSEEGGGLGILVCGTGIGMMISANKYKGIRAVDCTSELMAKMAREHNDANILCLGSHLVDQPTAQKITDTFINSKFEGAESHLRRLKKMDPGYNPDDCC
ncbi:MAG TPA: ribose 5-phosphate isomerase B [Candidatus Gracilibacteria bacterium]|nr:ribose 5-phosphate isomerase B [Candidatus Gracilibacteria bacterium]